MLKLVLNILLIPLYIVFFVLFLVIWGVFTLTGIGPILQYCYKRADDEILDLQKICAKNSDIRVITIPANVNSASGNASYKLVLRYTEPANFDPSIPPVCLPNGLGATMVVVSPWHEELVRRGFRVLSFDRLGVGFSEDNPSQRSPTATDVIREMDFVMNSVLPADSKWILVGGSMGSTVAQCYISAFPQKIAGFLNMDGLPYPFIKFKAQFMQASTIYKIYTYIIWTGILRPFIAMGVSSIEKHVISDAFSVKFVRAQLNQSRFFGNIAIELPTMMDLCEFASAAWGPLNLLSLDAEILEAMIRAPPNESVHIDENNGSRLTGLARSESEKGTDWVTTEEVDRAVAKMKSLVSNYGAVETSIDPYSGTNRAADEAETVSVPARVVSVPNLPEIWKKLPIRVMSGRNHDFGNSMMNSFYNDEVKSLNKIEKEFVLDLLISCLFFFFLLQLSSFFYLTYCFLFCFVLLLKF